jgi:hypothetical protein
LIIRFKNIFLVFCGLTVILSSYKNNEEIKYDFNKQYSIDQLQADFHQFREVLQSNHPRLYEYTSKDKFDFLFDSLFNAIKYKMTEREFQYFLTPIIEKAHCSHTKLLPSEYLAENINDYISAPPFKLYFDNYRAFIHKNYSNDTSIKIGAEILFINGIKTEQIIKNFASRIPNEGKNTTFIYNRLNVAVYGLFPALCDYPNIEKYKLTFINPGSQAIKEISLKSIKQNEYSKLNPTPANYTYKLIDSLNTAIITIHSFKFKADSIYTNFIKEIFREIKLKKIKNLIIDVRGNIGGLPEPAAEILRNISNKTFIYYNKKVSWKFDNTISPTEDCFKGKLYFLIDGGCRSTTGHFVSLIKYHNLGTLIGEETCASYSCNSNGRPYTLTNSGLIIECPYTTFDVAVRGQERGKGIIPDIYIKPSADNVIMGQDSILNYTLDEIKQNEK